MIITLGDALKELMQKLEQDRKNRFVLNQQIPQKSAKN